MQSVRDRSVWNLPGSTSGGGGTISVLPEVQKQITTANLANLSSINLDFDIDFDMIGDLFIYADQVIQVAVFIRSDPTQTYQQLDAAIYGAGVAGKLTYVIKGQRFPGSQIRIQLQNNSGVATLVLMAEAHFRSS